MADDTFVIYLVIAETPAGIVVCTKDPTSCLYEQLFAKYDTNKDSLVSTDSLQYIVNEAGLAPTLA